MSRYQNRPPIRSSPKSDAKVRHRRVPIWRRITTDSAQGTVLTLLIVITFARLVSAAITNPTPIAVPGDIVQFGRAFGWMLPLDEMQARTLITPWALPGKACKLDIALMTRSGGVLTVLAVRRDGVMASWAGGPTAAKTSACPKENGLLITNIGYSALLTRPMPRR